ncbi:MAG: PCRF domain-containing protein, partial [Pseudomonas sp.]
MSELNSLSEDPKLWDNPDRAQKIMRERTRLDGQIAGVRKLESDLSDQIELIAMAEAENDNSLVAEAEKILLSLKVDVRQRELESLLSGELDGNDCYLQVNAGAGGTEAQDWANILLRMYLRWADKRGFDATIIELSEGDVAGIKGATVHIKG